MYYLIQKVQIKARFGYLPESVGFVCLFDLQNPVGFLLPLNKTIMLQKSFCVLFGCAIICMIPLFSQEAISLEGTWKVKLDPENAGMVEKWFNDSFTDEITLPGSLDEHGIGNPLPEIHMGKLTSETRYVGSAWYQKEVVIPETWKNRRIELTLERACWETTVYVDGVHTPIENSLTTQHLHDLTGMLTPGLHLLTIQVDNTVKINIGHTFGNMLWPHALSEESQTNWNGIIGKIELISTPMVWIQDLQAYPDLEKKNIRIALKLRNRSGSPVHGTLDLSMDPDGSRLEDLSFSFGGADTILEVELPFGESPRYWDEFNPGLYTLKARIETRYGGNQQSVQTGLRDFKAVEQHFLLNGRKIYLRGKVCSAIFPLTGYPPMAVDRWREIFQIYKDYGLNHLRCHSWCPPEAAFRVADEMGFVLQIEPPLWDGYGLVGSIPERAAFILKETGRMVESYGNHPSFCLMSLGNELGDGTDPYLAYLLDYLKKKDSRHLYTSTTHPVGMDRKDDFFVAAATPKGSCRGIKPFTDYREQLDLLERPLIAHELGQPAMYPDYKEIGKYTGHLKPRHLIAFRKSLEKKHMLDQADDFVRASGALLVEIYKENIEAQLRTPNSAGFQLLDIQDYPGHGLATIGILDAFLDSKGLITSEEYRRFCSQTVPLIRMPGFVYTNSQVLKASAEVAHYGPTDIMDQTFQWRIINGKGKAIYSGVFAKATISTGTTTALGTIEADLSKIRKPEQLQIEVFLSGTKVINSWKCWVYPTEGKVEIPDDILLTSQLDEQALEVLQQGGKVLIIPEPETLEHVEVARWDPVFWSYQLFSQPKIMGILCDTDHPALDLFPTAFHSDWQWRDLLDQSEALVIDNTPPAYRPIVQFVPDFNTNFKLSALMEARVGNGAIMICNIDLLNNKTHPETANQLLRSILSYMESRQFISAPVLETELVEELLKRVPENSNKSEEPDASQAVVHVDAGALSTIGPPKRWSEDGELDQVNALKEDYAYSVEGSVYVDINQSVWFGDNLKIRVSCPAGFKGSFYVYMNDVNSQGRAAHIFFCGQDKGPLRRYDRNGVWLRFEVTPEMAQSGELLFDARNDAGPNVTVEKLILIAD